MAIATHMRSHHMDSIPIDTCIIGSFKLNSIDLSSLTSCGLMVTFHRFPLTLFDRIVSRRNESKINLSYLLYGTQNRKFDLSYPKSNANEGNPLETTDFPLGMINDGFYLLIDQPFPKSSDCACLGLSGKTRALVWLTSFWPGFWLLSTVTAPYHIQRDNGDLCLQHPRDGVQCAQCCGHAKTSRAEFL